MKNLSKATWLSALIFSITLAAAALAGPPASPMGAPGRKAPDQPVLLSDPAHKCGHPDSCPRITGKPGPCPDGCCTKICSCPVKG